MVKLIKEDVGFQSNYDVTGKIEKYRDRMKECAHDKEAWDALDQEIYQELSMLMDVKEASTDGYNNLANFRGSEFAKAKAAALGQKFSYPYVY